MSNGAENKAIFRRVIEELWNRHNLTVADELFAPHATSPDQPALPPGPEGIRQLATNFLAAFPDLRIEITDLIAQGDRVAGRLVERATHRGKFMEIQATGRPVTVTEVAIMQIRDGKVVTTWYCMDMLGLLRQIGPDPVVTRSGRGS